MSDEPDLVNDLFWRWYDNWRDGVDIPMDGLCEAYPDILANAEQLNELRELIADHRILESHRQTSTTVLPASLTVLGYDVLELLGEGGMGKVYKARQRSLDRVVVIKTISAPDSSALKRFRIEAAAAARTQHPNVVTIFDFLTLEDRHFLVMEYIAGVSLAKLVADGGPLPLGNAISCIRQAALGLQHLYECGIVHRDIKPSNLMLADGRHVVKILDFGLARLVADSANDELSESRLTKTNQVMETGDYMSPEQATAFHDVDIRGDIYSLGCTFFHLLAGRPPFRGSFFEKALQHKTTPPPSIQTLRSDVPPDVAAVLRKMLAKNPDDRFQTPAELVDAIGRSWSGSLGEWPVTRNAGESTHSNPVEHSASTNKSCLTSSTGENSGLNVDEPSDSNGGQSVIVQTPPDAAREMRVSLGTDVFLDLVLVPAGSFYMGAPPDEPGYNDDEVLHRVTISKPFYLSRYLITQEQYASVVGQNPSYFAGSNLPVENVSWYDALEFCKRLSTLCGKQVRLPTEAEWEHACRAGTTTAFSTGDSMTTQHANYDGNYTYSGGPRGLSRQRTTAIDMFPPNPWGLYDMHGNLWEWCSDWYGSYAEKHIIDPEGPPRGDIRVLRGGSWFRGPADCRSAQRDGLDPRRHHRDYGFRVAVTLTFSDRANQ